MRIGYSGVNTPKAPKCKGKRESAYARNKLLIDRSSGKHYRVLLTPAHGVLLSNGSYGYVLEPFRNESKTDRPVYTKWDIEQSGRFAPAKLPVV